MLGYGTKRSYECFKMRRVLVWIVWNYALVVNAQPFRPALAHYPPSVYQGSNQNWQVLQDEKGRIYSGNTNGLFVYEGKSWQKYTINNEGMVRSIYWDSSSGRLYVGGIGEFGYFKADNRGKFMYYCLSDSLPKSIKEHFLDVWRIWYLSGKYYFQTEQAIFMYNNGGFTWQKPEAGNFQYSFVADSILFVQENERGLCYLTAQETIGSLAGGRFFNTTGFFGDKSVSGIFRQADSSYLIITYREGWYRWRPFSNNKDTLPVKIKTAADNIMATEQVYNSVQIVSDKDTTYLLGLFRGGILKMNANGQLLERLSRANGLPDNEIYCLYPDKQGNVWIGVSGGLVRAQWLNANWQLCTAEPSNGIDGDITSIVYYKNRLYVSTSLGIFGWDSSMRRFQGLSGIENLGQCWKLVITENGLLAGTNDGVYEVLPTKVVKISQQAQFVYNIARSKTIKGLYWLSTSDNLLGLYWNKNKWEEYLINDSSLKDLTSVVEDKGGVLWVTTGLKGIYRVVFANGQWMDEPVKITLIDTTRGLPKMGGNQIYNTPLGVRINTTKGWYVYDSLTGRIVLADEKKKEIELYYRDSISEWLVFSDKRIIRDMSGRVDSISYHRIPKTDLLLDIFTSDKGVIWLASDKTIFRYEPKSTVSFGALFPTQITQVRIGKDSLWFSGMGNNTDLNMGSLGFIYNHIQITYSLPDFHDEKRISYQYRLLNSNLDTSWSELTIDNKKEYTNLSEGNYIFEVRGQNLYGAWGTVARVRFRILAPWYRSWWAYLFICVNGNFGYGLGDMA